MNGGAVTVTCGVQGPQGPPGATGFPIANIVPVVASANLTADQNSTLFNNIGASGLVNLNLCGPTDPFSPLSFSLLVVANQLLGFVAPTGVVIENGGDSGNSIQSNSVGGYITIVMVSATKWLVTNITGLWTLDGPASPTGPPPSPISNVVPVTTSQDLTPDQSTTLFTNSGATGEVDLTLPPVQMPFVTMTFSLLVVVAETLAFAVSAGVRIVNGPDSSSSGGSISSDTVGNMITVVIVSATEWVVTGVTGIWDVQ